MKKLKTVLLLLIIAGSFFTGSWYSRQGISRNDLSSERAARAQRDREREEEPPSPVPGMVLITPEKQQMVGVSVDVVEAKPVVHTIRLLGRVGADETRIYRINAAVDGWVKEVYYNTVGSRVKKDETLAIISNPQFLDAAQGYLYSLGTVERLGPGRRMELGRQETPNPSALDPFVVQRQIEILRSMGISDTQIEEIGRTRTISQDIRIVSPADGFITVRNVSPWERFQKGTELYRIADLSRVWILADVFEREAIYFKPGVEAKVTLPYKDLTYQATVSEVLPIFDPLTRTLKVRMETENPGFTLRPDMFVDVELPVTHPLALTVPANAVLDSGLRKTVFVDRGNGFFEPRPVETGWRTGNRVEIVKGLEPGERIVISGNFLIDSESKLELTAVGMQGTLSKDPVSGLEVSPRKAEKEGRKSTFQGKTYYFSSNEYKQQFEKEPEKYVKE